MLPEHWKIHLVGVREQETGDVITRDGEFIGTWSLVGGVFWAFTPDGADDHLFFDPFLGMLCSQIEEWHEALAPSVQT